METTPYILNDFKAFSLETTVEEIRFFFNQTTYSHFPVVKDNFFIGLISETEIEGIDKIEKEIGYFQYLFSFFFTEETDNLIEIMSVFSANQANIIPVVDAEKKYLGYFDLLDVLHLYNETPFMNNEGTVLLLEKETRDISYSEISQIVETSGGKILGLFTTESNDHSVKITIKFSAQDVNEIIQSFRRYEYKVLSNHEEDFYIEDLKERSKYLQKYLNI